MGSQGDKLPVRVADQPRRRHWRSRIARPCHLCHIRKLRCNREQPCQNCLARDEQACCQYRESRDATVPNACRNEKWDQLHQRINHLEEMVKKLIAERQQNSSSR